jgi:hypothetical protein
MKSLPMTIRTIKATEARLDEIYNAAKLGLKGDSLALSCGMRPEEYAQLCELDPMAALMAKKGKADAELEQAQLLAQASKNGDVKATLAILQNVHGWSDKPTQQSSFGAAGIVINIGSVDSPYVIEGTKVD